MSDESVFQGQPAYVEKTSNKKRFITIFFVLFLVIVTALGALYLLGSTSKRTMPQPANPIPTEVKTATPTPATASALLSTTPSATGSPAVKLALLSITVLNGSGTPGAAGKIASALKSAGFTDITIGNAKSFTYTGFTVYAKNTADLQQVQKIIAATDSSVKIITSISSAIPTDVEVIVGK